MSYKVEETGRSAFSGEIGVAFLFAQISFH